ncbi:hypothetical protein, partial [Devosia sp.]|uniref:hypothetical protein n=1 Tax=Devosia sp. TaxID=1871048 RepID=UPI001AC1FF29
MTEIALTTQRPSASAGASGLSRQTRLNDVLGWVLLVFVALVPIPFGSNRPFFWAVNAGLIGLAGIVYSACLLRLREPYRYGLARLAPSIILFLVVAAYLALQAIPLGWLLNFDQLAPYLAITTPQGATIAPTAISLAPGATWLMLLRWGTFGTFFFLVLQ